MNKQTFVELEPSQRRLNGRNQLDSHPRKTELSDIAAHEVMILATATAQALLNGWEMRERMKLRRVALIIVSGVVVVIGLGQLAIQLLKG